MTSESSTKKKFRVQVERTSTKSLWIEVEAEDEMSASEEALDQAGDHDFNSGTTIFHGYELGTVESSLDTEAPRRPKP